MQFHSHANQTHFHKNGFALRLALKQRHKGTRKWPIESVLTYRVRVEKIRWRPQESTEHPQVKLS